MIHLGECDWCGKHRLVGVHGNSIICEECFENG